MSDRNRSIWALIVNAFIVLSSFVVAVCGMVYGPGPGQLGTDMYGANYLRAFTSDSNILLGFVSVMMLSFHINNLVEKRGEIPYWAALLQLVAASATGLTMVVVVVFLMPMVAAFGVNPLRLFAGGTFFFHLLNPVLGCVSFILLTKGHIFGWKENLLGMLPGFLYSILYLVNVVFLRRWPDYYNFTLGGHYAWTPAVMLIMYAVMFVISRILIVWHNGVVRRQERKGNGA